MASSETSLLNDRSAAKLRVNFGVRVLATVMSNRVQRMRRERRRKKERRGRELEMERDEKSCIETKVGRFRGLGTGMLAFVFPVFEKSGGEGGYVSRDTTRHGLFLRTIARSTIVNWNVIRAARPWISHRYRVLRCPPLIHSVLTSVVLPVSAFVELFRWPIARIFSITILLSFYESPLPPPPLHRAASFG